MHLSVCLLVVKPAILLVPRDRQEASPAMASLSGE